VKLLVEGLWQYCSSPPGWCGEFFGSDRFRLDGKKTKVILALDFRLGSDYHFQFCAAIV
jgi:hypothetical protein